MTSIEAFFAAWSMTDDAERLATIAAATAPAVSYADPRTPEPLNGPDAIAEYVAMFAQAAPGATANVIKHDAHHGAARVTVEFKMADGLTQHGQYFVEPEDANAPITRMIGFVGTGAPE